MPVFSLGSLPSGPQRLDPRSPNALTAAQIGEWTVTAEDAVFADDDGVLFVTLARVEEVLDVATAMSATERRQANRIRNGVSLRVQTRFGDYLTDRASNPTRTFRDHLRAVGGEIEV